MKSSPGVGRALVVGHGLLERKTLLFRPHLFVVHWQEIVLLICLNNSIVLLKVPLYEDLYLPLATNMRIRLHCSSRTRRAWRSDLSFGAGIGTYRVINQNLL